MALFENSRYSQGQAEESLVENYSDGERFAQLNVMLTQRPFWRNDKTMDVLSRSPFGLTWKPLTESRGEELLMWFLEGFRVQTSHVPEKVQESKAPNQSFGSKCGELLATLDRASCGWRILQCSLLAEEPELLQTLPRWGIWDAGGLYQQKTPSGLTALRATVSRLYSIYGKESGFSEKGPTPIVGDASGSRSSKGKDRPDEGGLTWLTRKTLTPHGQSNNKGQQGGEFELSIRRLPTATKSDASGGPGCDGRLGGENLRTAIQRAPTTSSNDHRGSSKPGQRRGQLTDPEMGIIPAGGKLNPDWEDWYMGFPIGWTDVRPLETHRFRQWLGSHGIF